MAHDLQEAWGNALASIDEAVRALAQISLSPGGREFLNDLDSGEAGLCLELLDRVCPASSRLPFSTDPNYVAGTDEASARFNYKAIVPDCTYRFSQTSQKVARLGQDNGEDDGRGGSSHVGGILGDPTWNLEQYCDCNQITEARHDHRY